MGTSQITNTFRERDGRYSSALIQIGSTTPRICATTAIIERVRPKWHMPVAILTDLTTRQECARIVISKNII